MNSVVESVLVVFLRKT